MAKKQSSNARKRARRKALRETGKQRNIQENETENNESKKRKIDDKNKPEHDEEDELLAVAAAWASSDHHPTETSSQKMRRNGTPSARNRSNKQVVHRKPPPFPKELPVPKDGFLKNEQPYQKSFQAAMDTAYEGCVWDGPSEQESELQRALSTMDGYGLFRTDVTQPAGLGSKLVPSYVTRCLLGEEGTTYRYLGLRMFSHPWNGSGHTHKNQTNLKNALQSFGALNERLTKQSKEHLRQLELKRQERNEKVAAIQGRAGFDITLINKMTVHKKLRDEPMYKSNKYSVGWHADSSLEHFSTIAVYQTILNQSPSDGDWSVALRVTHDAEGPRGKRLGDITVEEDSPPIQIELPSGSTYYLLDDFNHHHQHAVLAPSNQSSTSIRFSSTHRLLRKGHNVRDIIDRCKTVCDNVHKHGIKRWRSEQLLLTELENEWLRQFFIQGPFHKEIHWGYWKAPIKELFKYWEKLEARTYQILLLLKNACLERCGETNERSKEALATIEQLRGHRNPREAIYDSLASLLSDRAKSRDLWAKRERDPIFKRLAPDCHPILFPVAYGGKRSVDTEMATSVMRDGTPPYLSELASNVKAWGFAYETCSSKGLLEDRLLCID